MSQESDTQSRHTELPPLKLSEEEVNAEAPWSDDALKRGDMADQLTGIVSDPKGLSTISVHGGWGTGKTFFLSRWRQHLQNEGLKAIYFNAWQDDFLHDPLLAILGQLAQDLTGRRYAKLASSTLNMGSKLVRQLPIVAAKQVTGLDFGALIDGERTFAAAYADLVKTRTELKRKLTDLATRVANAQKGRPLVFVIDELDRCRPTFAIELMERVKHIFDVPNLLFVFGINRDEMENFLQSIYGGIDADTYLRRFFDLELNLPPPDMKVFTRELIKKCELPSYFNNLFTGVQRPAGDDLGTIERYLPHLLDGLQVSLRDAQYCVRLLAMLARSQQPRELFMPIVITGLTALRTVNRKLYSSFIRGDVGTSNVIDWLDNRATERLFTGEELRQWNRLLSNIEASFYRSDIARGVSTSQTSSLETELNDLAAGNQLEEPQFVSRRLVRLGEGDSQMVKEILSQRSPYYHEGDSVSKVAGMLELSAQYIRE